MPLEPGVRLGPYEIVAPLGAGGMGEVYKAIDTRLGRAVAVKVLPAHVANSPALKARFEREARTISSLNHPHICTLHDIGHDAGTDFLVMEYLDGETLAERLRRGPLPLPDVLRIGAEIADALDKAHRQGVIHRDLKPGNVMLTKAGAKLLDFGLAKVQPATSIGVSGAPTVSTPLTGVGTIVGTYQYMAPEQVEGREADARTDIFAFGTILYEMVTGRRPFDGASPASVMAAILKDAPPPPSVIQPISPPALDGIIVTCLAKAPDDRWQSAGDVGRQLKLLQVRIGSATVAAVDARAATGGVSAAAPAGRPTTSKRWRVTAAFAAAVITLGLAGLAILREWPEQNAHEAVRFAFSVTGLQSPVSIAASPDGRYVVYIAAQTGQPSRLYLRPLSALEATPIAGTEQATAAFWSADSRYIGFAAQGQLKRVALDGGPPQTVTSLESGTLYGGTWSASGDILFGGGAGRPIRRVSASGGEAVDVTKVDGVAQGFPSFLPDGRHFLFSKVSTSGAEGVYVASLDSSNAPTLVVQGGSHAAYTPQGYLLFDRAGALMAQHFNLHTLTLSGDPVRIADGLFRTLIIVAPGQISGWSVSNTGILSYVGGGGPSGSAVPLSRLTWYDRRGRVLGTIAEPGRYAGVSLSPDGRRLAVHRHEDDGGIWIYDLQRNTWSQLTFDRTHDIDPLWSPDGQFIAYSSLNRGNIYRKLASGTGAEEALRPTSELQVATAWSPDGRTLLFVRSNPHVWSLSLRDRKAMQLLDSPGGEYQPQVSPDGRWLAYALGPIGTADVYIRAYPSLAGPWRISTQGGNNVRWSHDGRELFYMAGGGIMAADIQVNGDAISAGTPRLLFKTTMGFEIPGGVPYDVAPDGRFLASELVEAPGQNGEGPATPSITMVLNWDAGLKK